MFLTIEVVVDVAFYTMAEIIGEHGTETTPRQFFNRSSDHYWSIGNTDQLVYIAMCFVNPKAPAMEECNVELSLSMAFLTYMPRKDNKSHYVLKNNT